VIAEKQMSIVDSLYGATDSGKIAKINAQIAEINAELEKEHSTEFERKAEAVLSYLRSQLKPRSSGRTGTSDTNTPPPEFTTEWTDKNLGDIARIDLERQKSIEKLDQLAKKSLGEEFKTNEKYEEELFNLNLHYNGQLAELENKRIEEQAEKERQVIEAGWTARLAEMNMNPVQLIDKQMAEDLEELTKFAVDAYGFEAYRNEKSYREQMHALNEYYAKKREEAEIQRRESLLQEYTKGLSEISHNFELELAAAIEQGDVGAAARASARSCSGHSILPITFLTSLPAPHAAESSMT